MTYQIIKDELMAGATPQKAADLSRFFKTGKGQYGEGDQFMGVTVPVIRQIVKKYKLVERDDIQKLLQDPYHECRMIALQLLVNQYKNSKPDRSKQKEIFDFYLANTQFINNWDLVDLSCGEIVGKYLYDKSREPLYQLAHSGFLWEERIAIISTLPYIKSDQFDDTLQIAKILLHHPHDLIHKAVGWMLREIGKRDFEAEYQFLMENNRYQSMPRTMLRYAIERFPEELRQRILKS